MRITEQIPFLPMAVVTDFMLRPKERMDVVEVDGKPTVKMAPNQDYWVSDAAIERARRIFAEKDAALKEAMRNPIKPIEDGIKAVGG